jgi:tyrosyl-tRNA synthetase|tara:strand:+ start:569 stop:1789 length:1221 start_codon:yes stop_codon:yes gene_type:complete
LTFLKTFEERGFFKQTTHPEELKNRVESGRICAYIGFDPTADSLHVGHLIPLMGLAHLQRSGQRVIALMGGGTAMIGDPSGKTEMRKMLTEQQLEANVVKIKPQMERFLDFEGDSELINNSEWLRNLNYIDFLRDIGRHFSVNRMLSFETYKARLETGLSFLEFNYQLLQAYDFLELNKRYDCVLQMGGDDQWANILAGVDLIRRVHQNEAFGWTYPLLTTASGRKMGKTEKGAVWLDPEKTSPYEYYQYWINCEDADVEKFLTLFTFLPMDEVQSLGRLQGAEIREAKSRLALETASLIHGKEEALKAEKAAKSLFGDGGESEDIPSTQLDAILLQDGMGIFDAFRKSGLCKSNGEARRLMNQGGLYLNNEVVSDPDYRITAQDLLEGTALLRAGKKRYHRLTLQ